MTTFTLVAIVKDERERLSDLLSSARPHCWRAVIVDTGSTDGTPDLVRSLWPGADVTAVEWDGFGPARTVALSRAWRTADWLLALDADMTVEVDRDWEPDPTVDAYTVEMGNGGPFRWRLPLVLNGRIRFRSVGRCHEFTERVDGQPMRVLPTDAVRVRYATEGRSSPEKTAWQLALLERDAAERPDDPRTVFYMAQCLRELGRDDEARALYERRAEMGGWDEEAWYAAFQAALYAPDGQRIEALLRAWERRPERLEPLAYALRELNRGDLHRSAYALIPNMWPVQPPEGLFVADDPWRYGLAFERSVAAWWVGEHEESARLSADLLRLPDLPPNVREAVERNLALTREEAA